MPSQRPNILFFHIDNLGMGELGCYGGGILRGADSKRADKFATEGIKLTHYVVEPQCTPTRSALMTGRYPIRSGNHTIALGGNAGGIVRWEKPSPKFCPRPDTCRVVWGSGTSGRRTGDGRRITALTSGTARCAPTTNACGSKTPITFRSATAIRTCTRGARAKA